MIGVIDIGAHKFEEYEQWVKEGAKNFLLFEPISSNFEYLVKNFYEHIMYNVALANYQGETKMYVDSGHDCLSASILQPTLHGEDYPDILFDRVETVKVDKLDWTIYDRDDYDHLHMAVQGMELEVLKGAEQSLKHIDTISCQVFRKKLYEGSCLTQEVVEWLDDRGFDLVQIVKRGIPWDVAKFKRRK
jgi:FkbM family methyltransferase